MIVCEFVMVVSNDCWLWLIVVIVLGDGSFCLFCLFAMRVCVCADCLL